MKRVLANMSMMHFRVSLEVRERLEYHSRRLGADMNDLVREAVILYMENLDEKEMAFIAAKKLRENKKGKFIPYEWTPRGLKRDLPTPSFLPSSTKPKLVATSIPSTAATPLAEKLRKSFRRWAEYIEEAGNHSDKEKRAEEVIRDMQERTSSEKEVEFCYNEFKEFMQQRLDALTRKDVIKLDESVIIGGDIDDSR